MSRRTALRRSCLLAVAALALVLPATAGAAEPTRYALLVGVIEYDHAKLPNLSYTENDVEELGEVLKGSGFKVLRLTSTRGKKQEKARPTAKNIRAALKGILDRVTKHDTVLVGLAGHGLQLKVARTGASGKATESDEPFFCPTDARLKSTTDPRVLSETLIPLNELFKQLEESGAGMKLLLVDACRNDPAAGRNVDTDALPRPPRGTAALFSCSSGERAFESEKLGTGHGVFFHHVIEGLKGEAKNKKGQITWDSLAEHVKDKVSDEVPVLIGGGAKQTPQEIKNLTGKSPVLVTPVARGMSEGDKLYRLGLEHELGKGRKRDLAEAIRCYKQAAEMGSADAQHALGVKYQHGQGVEMNWKEAVRWFRAAGNQGHAQAQNSLGMMYANGLGVEADHLEAVKLYRKAAERGLAAAQNNLAWMYLTGQGVGLSRNEARKWYQKAAEQGDEHAKISLASLK
jgi:hypothetical protein